MMLLLKRIWYFLCGRFMIAKIKRDLFKEYGRRLEDFRQKLIHDTSVTDEDLESKFLEEADRLRKVLQDKIKQEIADLLAKIVKNAS